jgi:phosphoadenosine phosphosulfate reductase
MLAPLVSPRVKMVKKKLASGEPCQKCAQAEEMLRRRDLWDTIDEVIWADETDETSPGMMLAKHYQIDLAPFFLVEQDGEAFVYPSAIKVAKEVLVPKKELMATLSPGGITDAGESAGPPGSLAPAWTQELVQADATTLEGVSPEAIVGHVLSRLGERCAIAFSGAEDVALIDMAAKSGRPFSVFCLDTGRLHPETYRFIDTVRQFYGIEIRLVSPDFVALEELVRKKGLFSFYEDGHGECCGVRKVAPLRRALSAFDGWITGQRRDQSPTRTEVPVLSWDTSHKAEGMVKANPLALLSQAEVWEYIRRNDVPYNELHDRGYISIGCEPCTRAARPGEHERAARWWWEEATQRECGLHAK